MVHLVIDPQLVVGVHGNPGVLGQMKAVIHSRKNHAYYEVYMLLVTQTSLQLLFCCVATN
jgi:hypothetical protein